MPDSPGTKPCWGLLIGTEAICFSYNGGHPMTACGTATCPVAKNPAFWSITVYDAQGFIAPENSIVNSSTVKLKSDGTFTVFYGSKELCGDARNRSDTPESISFMMRVYRPDPSVRNGGYTPPPTISVKGLLREQLLADPLTGCQVVRSPISKDGLGTRSGTAHHWKCKGANPRRTRLASSSAHALSR